MPKKMSEKQLAANRENAKKGGRPKGYIAIQAEKARQILVEELMKNWTPIVKKAMQQALAGDATARAWLKDNGFGKALDNLAITDPDDVLKNIIIQKNVKAKRNDRSTA